MRRIVYPLVLIASLASGTARADNLLVNPGFELPVGTGYASLPGNSAVVTGWTTVLSGVEWFNASSYGGAADGVMVVDLANYTYLDGGGIEQTFATEVGRIYDLAFSLGTQQSFGRDGTAHIDVTVAGSTTGHDVVNHTGVMAWTPVSLSFQATGSSTTLRFTNTQNPYLHFAYVDGVSAVAAVPEPEAWGLMLAGLGLIGLRLRRGGSLFNHA